MPITMAEMMIMASTVFTPDIVKAIESAEFQMDDIDQLTREDINEEFRGFRFGIRKRLWLFFKSMKTSTSSQSQDGPTKVVANRDATPVIERGKPYMIKEVFSKPQNVVPDVSLKEHQQQASENLVPESSDDDDGESSSSSFNQSLPLFHSETFSPFSIPYPGNITSPFPFSEMLKDVLTNVDNIKDNESLTNCLVREVYTVLKNAVGATLSQDDLRFTASMLCVEYPALVRDGKEGWMFLYTALKSWMNHMETGQTSSSTTHENTNLGVDAVSGEPLEISGTSGLKQFSLKRTNPIARRVPLPYPDGIDWPFPLNEALREYLTSGNNILDIRNRKAFQELVRDISNILENVLGRNPDQYEVRCVVGNLCVEYPVLCLNGERFCPMLHRAIRKRFNNIDQKRRNQMIPMHTIHPPPAGDTVKLELQILESTVQAQKRQRIEEHECSIINYSTDS